ncbi:PQQ-dependent sugar dehydrogenase [Costertonia aggregata]|uniref:PQQ-dependent sugar dehydrogenase n=1 Tax=Costertonia aggregata TaxID=343403 RepID=A0A7H9AKP8_9FLAO|nr:PQQ-dependent sugar dehydrogenase [Costertonia aggregata]QLG44062.1 PQQ-dependent sugar dehydrogenase [Costertonia aggregata]
MKKSIVLTHIFVVMLTVSCGQEAKNEINTPSETSFSAELFIDNLQIPWGMAFLPDGSLLITEKAGELIHFKDGKKTLVSNVPEVYTRGQGGLLDIETHPDYVNNGWLYLSYSSEEGDEKGGHTAIMRAKLNGNTLVEKQLLYKASPNTTKGQHFGSRIEFDDEGYLYFSIGDRGNRAVNPQDITRDGGKIYRINADGSIPQDNPFANETNAKEAIFSYGHRNPQGMMKNPYTGAIWVHEHGPKGGDEINIIKKAANFGWPVITYGVNYSGTPITDETSREGMEQPVHYWVPSIAPSGMTFVNSDKYPEWKGNLLVGSLSFQYLELLVMNGEKVTDRQKLLDGFGRVRNVKQGPDGYIYVAVEGKGIYKLIPENQ